MTIDEITRKISAMQETHGLQLFPGAKEKDLDDLEEKLSMQLPGDVRTFYRFSNGMEGKNDAFRIIPLEEILHIVKDSCTNRFFIAEHMVYTDVWTLRVEDNNKYSIFTVNDKGRQVTLTHSLAGFLQCYLAGGVTGKGGLHDWQKEKENK